MPHHDAGHDRLAGNAVVWSGADRPDRAGADMENVFVVGLEPFNLELLQTIEPGRYRFLPLFDYAEVEHPPGNEYPSLDRLVERALATFDGQDGGADAVIGYWDLPTSLIVPLVARAAGLPGVPLEAVAQCEHKYWARIRQAEALGDLVPRFQALDPFADDPLADLELDYPFWLKPVKSHSSFLGFHIDGPETFRSHLGQIRDRIGIMARPLNEFMAHVDAPDEIRAVDGYHCIAEEIISRGFQCTLEGWRLGNECEVFGIVDSIRSGRHHSSFARYQYPSKLPVEVQRRMIAAAKRLMHHIDYTGGAFNIEFFWNADDDSIRLLEVNSRISKSHSPLFLMVDGASNQKVVVELALGRRPEFPHRAGRFALAAKFMLRYFEDGVVERAPGRHAVHAVRHAFDEAMLRVFVERGMRLSELPLQDSYSYEVAEIFLGADRQKALLDKYLKACELLDLRVRPVGAATDATPAQR
jgi:hypothetical protein